jgi:hypothetical protein
MVETHLKHQSCGFFSHMRSDQMKEQPLTIGTYFTILLHYRQDQISVVFLVRTSVVVVNCLFCLSFQNDIFSMLRPSSSAMLLQALEEISRPRGTMRQLRIERKQTILRTT